MSIWAAFLELLLLPLSLFSKLPDVTIVIFAWWLFKDFSRAFDALSDVLLVVALIAIFFCDIKRSLIKVTAYMANALTVGEIFKAICQGQREGVLKSEAIFKSDIFQDMIGVFANTLPLPYRKDYEDLITVYSGIKRNSKLAAFFDNAVNSIYSDGYHPGKVFDDLETR